VSPPGKQGTWLRLLNDKQLAEIYHRLRLGQPAYRLASIAQKEWGIRRKASPKSLARAIRKFKEDTLGVLGVEKTAASDKRREAGKRLEERGAFIPSCAMAGGLALEDHIFKGIALAAPYIKAICLGRASMTAAMVGNTVGEMVKKGKVPSDLAKYGSDIDHIFILAAKLRDKYGKDFEKIPPGTIGMITYFDRLNAGLQQLMAGARKFKLNYISRDDLCALTREASEISGIAYVMDADRDEIEKIFRSSRSQGSRARILNLNIETLVRSKGL
jgi:hypothetical protein